jgi:hypothetical protein
VTACPPRFAAEAAGACPRPTESAPTAAMQVKAGWTPGKSSGLFWRSLRRSKRPYSISSADALSISEALSRNHFAYALVDGGLPVQSIGTRLSHIRRPTIAMPISSQTALNSAVPKLASASRIFCLIVERVLLRECDLVLFDVFCVETAGVPRSRSHLREWHPLIRRWDCYCTCSQHLGRRLAGAGDGSRLARSPQWPCVNALPDSTCRVIAPLLPTAQFLARRAPKWRRIVVRRRVLRRDNRDPHR